MTNRNTPIMQPADFERLLEVYGGDRTRWPLVARASAAARLASEPDAQRLLGEAQALDAVLFQITDPHASELTVLANRIVAVAQSSPRLQTASAGSTGVSPRLPALPRSTIGVSREMARGAALLAASLMIGVFVGQSQVGARAVPVLQAISGISLISANDRLALLDLHFDQSDDFE